MSKQYTVTVVAPEIDPTCRHQQIMATFDRLSSGEWMRLVNNHDPKPLYYQFMMERKDQFIWQYMEEGPINWEVAIGKK